FTASGSYDASGAASNATNGLTSALIQAKIGAGVYDASGAANNTTNNQLYAISQGGAVTNQPQTIFGGYNNASAAVTSAVHYSVPWAVVGAAYLNTTESVEQVALPPLGAHGAWVSNFWVDVSICSQLNATTNATYTVRTNGVSTAMVLTPTVVGNGYTDSAAAHAFYVTNGALISIMHTWTYAFNATQVSVNWSFQVYPQ